MAIPVPIPSGALPITDADTARAESLVAAIAQILKSGTSGGTATLRTPATITPAGIDPPIDPLTGLPALQSVVLDTPQAQLFYRQLALAIAKTIVPYASSTVAGITRLSTDPTDPAQPTAINAEEASVTPTPNKIPRAGPAGTIDPGWVGAGPGPGPFIDSTFDGTCVSTNVVGDIVRITGAGKTVDKVDCSDESKMLAIGIIISKSSSTSCVVQTNDLVTSVYTGLTPGKLYFVGTDGRPTLTRPSPPIGGSILVQPIGYAIDTNLFLVTPSTAIVRLRG